jgi:cation diffusion facilitator CzcD-associated flavoprotein CzcO
MGAGIAGMATKWLVPERMKKARFRQAFERMLDLGWRVKMREKIRHNLHRRRCGLPTSDEDYKKLM